MKKNVLTQNEFSSFNATYINAFDENQTLTEGLQNGMNEFVTFMQSIPAEKLEYRYAPNKWTIKDILLHCIDTERIFSYRALRIGRGDKTPLAGFEENDYVPEAMATKRSLESLLSEYQFVRKTTITLFTHFSDEQLAYLGTASNNSISVRAIGFLISGHQAHHLQVIKERYLL